MRLLRIPGAVLCCILTLTSLACAEVVQKTVATVNGVNLSSADLNQEVQRILPLEMSFHGGLSDEKMKNIQARAMTALVEKELQYQDGLKRGLRLDKKQLAEQLKALKGRFKTDNDFEVAMKQSGFSEEGLNRFFERNYIAEAVKKQVVDNRVNITDEMVKNFYEKNKNMFLKPEEYRASHILIKVDPAASEAERKVLRERAELLLDKIRKGADFAELASNESDDLSRLKGGDIGYFHKGRTVPEFEGAVRQLKVGEVSGIVESLYGFHIIKLTDKKETHQMTYTESRDRIYTQMIEQEKKRLNNEWMSELQQKAKIIYPEKD